jgi:hypothetical protein
MLLHYLKLQPIKCNYYWRNAPLIDLRGPNVTNNFNLKK